MFILSFVGLQTEFGLVNKFIDHLYPRLVSISNYSATANLHSSQMARARAKPFNACCAFTNRSLAIASNSGDILSCTHSVPLFTTSHAELTLNWVSSLAYNISERPSRNNRFDYCSPTVHYYDFVASDGNVFMEPLTRNSRCLQSDHSATCM
jgi:hypothetical protein